MIPAQRVHLICLAPHEMSEECRPCTQTGPAKSITYFISRPSWLMEAQRPSRISLPNTLGTESWTSFADHAYEPFDADEVFSDLETFRQDLHGGPDLRRLRSFSAKEAAEVAAVTRFRLELERREELNEYEDDYPEPLVNTAFSAHAEHLSPIYSCGIWIKAGQLLSTTIQAAQDEQDTRANSRWWHRQDFRGDPECSPAEHSSTVTTWWRRGASASQVSLTTRNELGRKRCFEQLAFAAVAC